MALAFKDEGFIEELQSLTTEKEQRSNLDAIAEVLRPYEVHIQAALARRVQMTRLIPLLKRRFTGDRRVPSDGQLRRYLISLGGGPQTTEALVRQNLDRIKRDISGGKPINKIALSLAPQIHRAASSVEKAITSVLKSQSHTS